MARSTIVTSADPFGELLQRAIVSLAATTRRRAIWAVFLAIASIVTIPVGLLLARNLPDGPARGTIIGLGCTPFVLAVLLVVAAQRSRGGIRALEEGPYLSADAVRWTQRPDGCNIALFTPGDEISNARPFAVVRLPTRQPPIVARVWLCGPAERDRRSGAAAVIDEFGGVVGAGHLVSESVALKRWNRRVVR